MSKLPFMQFYPDLWLTEPGLRACSSVTRSLWIDLLCHMWKATERGVLRTGSQVWGIREIAGAIGVDPAAAQEQLNELLRNGVTERREADGALINRRMVREERERELSRGRQRKSRSCHADVTPDITEVRSHISEVESKACSPDPRSEGNLENAAMPSTAFEGFWEAYPRKVAKIQAERAWARVPTAELAEVVIGLEAWKRSRQWQDPQFVPHAATWLHRKQWRERPPEEGANGSRELSKTQQRSRTNAQVLNRVGEAMAGGVRGALPPRVDGVERPGLPKRAG